MSQPDQGAVEEITITDVSSAAQALEDRWTEEEENLETPEDQHEEEVQEEDPAEEEIEAESESENPDEQDEEAQFETTEDLAEALGMDMETFLSTIKTTRKVNGEVEEVTLAELRDGNMKEADYRRKTTELAEQRKALDAERAQKTEQLQTGLEQVSAMLTNAEQALQNEYNAVNWDELKEYDKEDYLIKEAEFRKRWDKIQQDRQAVQSQTYELRQQQQAEEQTFLRDMINKEAELLANAIPSWDNREAREKDQADLNAFLVKNGFSEAEFLLQTDQYGNITHPGLVDHRIIPLLIDAMKYRSLGEQKETAKKKVKKLPPVIKPGNKQTRKEINLTKRNEKVQKFKKTGSRDDLVDALIDRM